MIFSVDQFGVYRKHNPDMSVIAEIPALESNADYQAMQDWRNAGNLLEIFDSPTAPVIVPESVTPRQIRMALTELNMRDGIEAFVEQSSWEVKDTWRSSTLVFRNNPVLLQMLPALGLTPTQADQIFILAATK